MYQKIIVLGNLGQDPEMRYMPDGTAVTNFSIATNRRWTDAASGEQREETVWFRCSAWGRSGETINEYFDKGKMILVEGRIKPDPQTGGPRTFTRLERWSFAGSGGDEYDSGSGSVRSGTPSAQEEDEIPF
jgi:single-strand DNA-binding protein